MRLLLIRHGETADNIARTIGSRLPGPALSGTGAAQAVALGQALEAEGLQRIHSSRALRAAQTAAGAANTLGIPRIEIDGAHEIDAGDLEGRPYTEAMAGYAGTMQRWWTDRSARIAGGENGIEFMARFDRAVDSITTGAGHEPVVALVSHEAAITVWAASTAINLDAEFSRTHGVRNTGIVELEGSTDGGWRAVSWDGIPIPA